MSNSTIVSVKIKTIVDGKRQVGELNVGLAELERATERVRRQAETISFAAVADAAAQLQNTVSQIMSTLQDLSTAYAAQIEAETKLATVMQQRMSATQADIQAIKDLASAQQSLGVIGDEVQLAGAQQIATFITQRQTLETLLPAMNNLLAQQKGLNATQSDAVSVGNLFGKAMMGNANALKRVGITLSDTQKRIIENGTESEKAAALAQAITDNVGDMNAQLAATDVGKAKQLENTLGDIKEKIGGLVQGALPFVQIAAATTTAVTGVTKLMAAIKALAAAQSISAIRSKAGAIAMAAWSSTAGLGTAVTNALTVSFGMNAVAARVCAAAIRGLLIATGVGIAIVALGLAVDALCSSMMSASGKADELSGEIKSLEQCQEGLQQTASRMVAQEMADVERLYQTAIDEEKSRKKRIEAVRQMQQMYPDYFKNINAEQLDVNALGAAYQKLSDDIYAAAEARAAFEQIVVEKKKRNALEWELLQLDEQKKQALKDFDEKRQQKKPQYGTALVMQTPILSKPGSAGYINKAISDNTDVAQRMVYQSIEGRYRNKEADIYRQMSEIDKKIGFLQTKGAQYAEVRKQPVIPGAGGSGGHRGSASGSGATKPETDKDKAGKLNIEEMTGRALNTLEDYDKLLADIRLKQRFSTQEDYKALQTLYEAVNEGKNEFIGAKKELTGKDKADAIDVLEVLSRELDSVADCDKALEDLRYKQRYASVEEYKSIGAMIEKLEKLKDSIKGVFDYVPGDVSTLKTMGELQKAISYYTEQQQRQSADEIQATQNIIDKLNAKNDALQRGVSLLQKQRDLDKLNSMSKGERNAAARSVGFDGYTESIRELQQMLNDTANPVTSQQKEQIEDLIQQYNRLRRTCVFSFDTMKDGWSSIKGINNAVGSIKDALESNATAWEKIISVIDAVISAFEAVRSIANIVNMITAVTKVGATAQVAAGAAAMQSATMQSTASAVNVAANKAETTSLLELATAHIIAKYAAIPAAGLAAAAAELGIMTGLMATAKAIPAFANGGLAYGPTLGIFGEYAGAKTNPEVIAPLDKLQGMINMGGGTYPERIELVAKADGLYGVIKKQARRLTR